ncbi:MAG: RNase adapter RapZ [Acidimicrobiales bacterium]
MIELVLVAGMSGAGRSSAAASLEDMGWFVIDNMPPALIPKIVELADGKGEVTSVALVVGREAARSVEALQESLTSLREQLLHVTAIFLDASDDALLQRYEGTKRRHPVEGDGGVLEAIHREREQLSGIKDLADIVIDTSDLSVHQLRDRIGEVFSSHGDQGQSMRVIVSSFGYKYGLPRDSDMVFDCRFLPNPYWSPALREFSGLDPEIAEFLEKSELTITYREQLSSMLSFLLPNFVKEGKSYLSIAVGCTGGRHRSVYLAEQIGTMLRELGANVTTRHRDINK